MIVTQVVVEFGLVEGKQSLNLPDFQRLRYSVKFFRRVVSVEQAPCETVQQVMGWENRRSLLRKKSMRSSVTLL